MMRFIATFALGTLTMAMPSLAWAGGSGNKSCTFDIPDLDVSGDNYYGAGGPLWNWCDQGFLKNLVQGYGMSKDDWDHGFGWEDACNNTKPFARFAAVRVLLHTAATKPQLSGNIDASRPFIDWALLWSWYIVSSLKARCHEDEDGAVAFYLNGSITLNAVTNGQSRDGYFYGWDVPSRAAMLLHEADHWNTGSHHVADGKMDSAWGVGAYTTEVWYLSDYAYVANGAAGRLAPFELRCSAARNANALLREKFVQDPGFTVELSGCPGAEPLIE